MLKKKEKKKTFLQTEKPDAKPEKLGLNIEIIWRKDSLVSAENQKRGWD